MLNSVKLGLFTLVLGLLSCQSESDLPVDYRLEHEISIVPKVGKIRVDSGFFKINEETVILVWNDSTSGADYLKKIIDKASTFQIPIIKIKGEEFKAYENFIMVSNANKTVGLETYDLKIDSHSIRISAMDNVGVMHGVQTLRQLFVREFHSGIKRNTWGLPSLKITDWATFKHRGLLLDCARHFFDVEVVKKYIDLLALYKMNVLHWHLTEDQGWRVEIDAFPNLTEIGAWRSEENGEVYGGFYNKQEIQEIVAYAAEREIMVIPEIELPGHAQAAIASYPYLSCTGEQVKVANDWGVFKEIYCAGNDSVFNFIETVLDEVLNLFPSKYIHIGGDEAPKYRWEHCEKCQKRMKKNGLKDEHELQTYFISRVEKYLNSKGRQLIGWDEILEGGLSENATIQSWRGMEGGVIAAKAHHKAIMSPTSHAYFDYDLQAIDLEKVYSFNPIPEVLTDEEAKYIVGGECNMWTEHVLNDSVLDSKVFPRLLAMSEVLWSGSNDKSFDEFYNRIQAQYPILKALGVKFGAESVPVNINVIIENKQVTIEAESAQGNLLIKYLWECDTCVHYSTYENPITLIKPGLLKMQAFKGSETYGLPIVQKFEKHKAIGEVVMYTSIYNQWYTAKGDYALVDGKIGSIDFKDGCWQGFWGTDIVVDIDLGKTEIVSCIESHFYQYNNSWIFMPISVAYEGSIDGVNFFEIGSVPTKTNPKARGKHVEDYTWQVDDLEMRYVRLTAKNIGKVPSWHEAAGSDAWLFIDEIVIK